MELLVVLLSFESGAFTTTGICIGGVLEFWI
jgi:hypothetical protein